MWSLIIICGLSLLFLLLENGRKPRLFPPGPPPLPVAGNLFSVWSQLKKLKYHHRVWQLWSQQYGPLLGLKLGFTNVIVVSGKDFIREVSSREVFNGRPSGFFYLMRTFGKKLGLVFSDGPSWIRTRRLVLKYLKNFGYGTRFMESNIAEECRSLVELRMADAGQPVLVNQMLDVSIVNILWQLVAGKRYDLTDHRLKRLCYLVKKAFTVVDMSGGILNSMPFLRHIMPGITGYTELTEINAALHVFLRETIQEHRDTVDLKNPRDVIDTFLMEMMEEKDKKFIVTPEELQSVCLDLLQAGLETVGNTAVFLLLYVVREQRVQARLHREIDEVIGKERAPTLKDRNRMVYTEAVLLETLRISSVAAVGIPHMALDDTKLGGYVIPKSTIILLAMYDLHNGSHWKEPDVFRPERFLTKDGNLIQDEWLMPFGTGKRRCIGEGLARSELYMFLTHILQKFRLKLPDEDPMPSTEPIDGVTLSAEPFRIIFEPRVSQTQDNGTISVLTSQPKFN